MGNFSLFFYLILTKIRVWSLGSGLQAHEFFGEISGSMVWQWVAGRDRVSLLGVCSGLVLMLGLVGCKPSGGEERTSAVEGGGKGQAVHGQCQWVARSVAVQWTAFKTTEKIPVHGRFREVEALDLDSSGSSAVAAFRRARVAIPVRSLFTGDTMRDRTILEDFFLVMKGGDTIYAEMVRILEAKDTMLIRIRMNGMESIVPFRYWVRSGGELDTVVAEGEIDVLSMFGAEEALRRLNVACRDKHTGKDGESKTWEVVEVRVVGLVRRSCPS